MKGESSMAQSSEIQKQVDSVRRRLLAAGLVASAAPRYLFCGAAVAKPLPACRTKLSTKGWTADISLVESRAGKKSIKATADIWLTKAQIKKPGDAPIDAFFDEPKNTPFKVSQVDTLAREYTLVFSSVQYYYDFNLKVGVYDKQSKKFFHYLGGKRFNDDALATNFIVDDVEVVNGARARAVSNPRLPRAVMRKGKSLRVELIDVDGLLSGKKGNVLISLRMQLSDLTKLSRRVRVAERKLRKMFRGKECKPDSNGCFLTTACCSAVGLHDDCWELSVLRAFRDNILTTMHDGKEQLQWYQKYAPIMTEEIARLEDAKQIFLRSYLFYILPCVIFYHLGMFESLRSRYVKMIQYLQKTLAVNRSILSQVSH